MELFLVLFLLCGAGFYFTLRWARRKNPEQYKKIKQEIKHGFKD